MCTLRHGHPIFALPCLAYQAKYLPYPGIFYNTASAFPLSFVLLRSLYILSTIQINSNKSNFNVNRTGRDATGRICFDVIKIFCVFFGLFVASHVHVASLY